MLIHTIISTSQLKKRLGMCKFCYLRILGCSHLLTLKHKAPLESRRTSHLHKTRNPFNKSTSVQCRLYSIVHNPLTYSFSYIYNTPSRCLSVKQSSNIYYAIFVEYLSNLNHGMQKAVLYYSRRIGWH